MWIMLGKTRRKTRRENGRTPARTFLLTLAGAAVTLTAPGAQARDGVAAVIRDSEAPISYSVELEPHLLVGSAPPGGGVGSGAGLGARASVVLRPQGFIEGINDSVAIGFGLDFGHYDARYGLNGYRDQCISTAPGPAGTTICTGVTGGTYNYLFLPLVMQWNFWFTDRWSAFGEPGLDFFHLGDRGFGITPALYLGGRFRLTDTITITGRLGYPTLGLGASFMM
jgi:hypothetical protein